MTPEKLATYIDQLLEIQNFRDYCPNGLQVEGRDSISRMVAGVTASQALIDHAIAVHADAILVHHGWFWRGEDGRVTGIRKRRLASLLSHDISLLAYHLPLDAHPDLGNNAQWARRLNWQPKGRFGDQAMGWWGLNGQEESVGQLAARLGSVLGRIPMLIGDDGRRAVRLAWCSGGAQSYLEQAIALGADVFLSGEISEQTVHLARESGVAYIACGHHATERWGVAALAGHLATELGLHCEFVDIDNPV